MATQPKTIPFSATPNRPKTVPFSSSKFPTGKPASVDQDFQQKLAQASNDDGLLPYSKMQFTPTDVGETRSVKGAIGPTITNQLKSVANLGVGIAHFLDPVSNIKKIDQAAKAGVGYFQQAKETAASQQAVKGYIPQLQEQIAKNKSMGKDTTNLERLLKEAGGQEVTSPTFNLDVAKQLPSAGYKTLTPPALQKGVTATKEKGFSEGFHAAVQSIAEDPQQLAPYFLLAKGYVEENLPAVDKTISKTGDLVTKPTEVVATKLADYGKKLATFGTSQATGLNPQTVKTILANPSEFSGEQMKQYSRETIGREVHSDITKRVDELSETGKEYQTIRQAKTAVNIPSSTVSDVLAKYGIILKDGKITTSAESEPLKAGDIRDLQNFIDQYGKESELTSNSFLNARKSLDILSEYGTDKSDVSTRISRDLRSAYDKIGKAQVPGLKELDTQYAPEVKLLKQIKSDYLNPDGTFKDNAITKISNLTNKGREQILERLSKINPDISRKLTILKALEDIQNASGQKVGTYGRAAVGISGLVTGNVPAIIGAILATPEIATQILRGVGKLQGLKDPVINGIIKTFTTDIKIPEKLKNYKPNIGLSIEDVSPKGKELATPKSAPIFKGFKDLSTKILSKLEGRSEVSKQFISDLTNSGDIRQAERDLIRKTLEDFPDKVPVKEFADKIKTELLPLKTQTIINPRYENITLPDELRGNVASYNEHIYNSPIKTSAGDVHFSPYGESSRRAGTDATQNYFAHTRIEDLASNPKDEFALKTLERTRGTQGYGGKASKVERTILGDKISQDATTRRVIELQSDLFQKGRLEEEGTGGYEYELENKINQGNKAGIVKWQKIVNERKAELQKLEPYRNTWQERIIKEEVKQAAKDGKTKLQFPTGETAMKIEGIGQVDRGFMNFENGRMTTLTKPENLEIGREIIDQAGSNWIITDVLGDGKFKAVPKDRFSSQELKTLLNDFEHAPHGLKVPFETFQETFDISGKVDTNNPIYRFYEKTVGKYLQNKYNAERVKDPQGVEWWQVDVKPEMKKKPIDVFSQKKKEQAYA